MEELKFLEIGKTKPLPRAKYWMDKAKAMKKVAYVSSGAMYILGFLTGIFIALI